MNTAISIVALLFLAAAACIVAGVQMLLGNAWALISAGVLLFGAATYLRARLTPHG